jgi:hypothetical protein
MQEASIPKPKEWIERVTEPKINDAVALETNAGMNHSQASPEPKRL